LLGEAPREPHSWLALADEGDNGEKMHLSQLCPVTRLGGVSNGNENQGVVRLLHTEGKFGSAKLPTATPLSAVRSMS
jgi:hypothetical protein